MTTDFLAGRTTLRYYLDTEFYEDGRTIDLISLGIVCEDGRELYAVSLDADLGRVSEWVKRHVLTQLPPPGDAAWMTRTAMRAAVTAFTNVGRPEVWGYYADYDWVVLCQLFGTMMDLPDHLPRYCMDLKQLAVSLGDPQLPQQEAGEHNALEDARWNRRTHAFLGRLAKGRGR